MSNFHSAAGTNVNLTGRKQILIQKSCCLFFDGKTVIIFGKNFKAYKVRFNFSKKRSRFFLLKKILNETRNFAVPFSESGKVFYFARNRTEKIALYFLPKSYRGGKRHLFKRCQIG